MLATRQGKSIRFNEGEVREMGRTASGVKGIELSENDVLIGMVIVSGDGTVLIVTENGYGKRSFVEDYSLQHRGGKGVITLKTNDKTGLLVAIEEAVDDNDVMIITQKGIIIRQNIGQISVIGRNTQGFRLIRVDDGDVIADVATVVADEGEDEDDQDENASDVDLNTNGAPQNDNDYTSDQ